MSTFTAWAKDAGLRAVKTAAQAAAAAITTNTASLTHLNLADVAAVAGLAAVWSVLQNLSRLKVSDPDADALVQAVLAKVKESLPANPTPTVPLFPPTTIGSPGQVTITNPDLGASPTVTA